MYAVIEMTAFKKLAEGFGVKCKIRARLE